MQIAFTNKILNAVAECSFVRKIGKVDQFQGSIIESIGPDVFLGEICEIHSRTTGNIVSAEVVGFKAGRAQLIPFGNIRGIQIGSEVISTGAAINVPIGDSVLGCVLDAFGDSLTDTNSNDSSETSSIFEESCNPLLRPKITERLDTQVKVIDSLLTIGKGQKLGIFAGSGVGKSTLLGMLARNVKSDVNVIALVGERSREVVEFIEEILGEEGLKKSVIVVATSEQSALARTHAAFTATTIAEYFCEKGNDVLFMMDSLTRLAMAQREISLQIGEPPTSRGYTPSVFTILPKLIERAGNSESGGSITGLYTVLVEGDDLNDPISDYARATLDGHIVLSRDLANSGVYPAIDVLKSKSRLAAKLISPRLHDLSEKVLEIYSLYYEYKDMIAIGAYKSGSNPRLDNAIKAFDKLSTYFRQSSADSVSPEDTLSGLSGILS